MVAEYTATIRWSRGEREFADDQYSRGHEWVFDGGITVPASASPHIVPLPLSVEEHVDPEEAFVASLSSCHMLFFLSLAVRRGVVVDKYTDHAIGHMERNADGKIAMTRVVLRPEASYAELPDPALIERLHHRAHELCFIANSVKTDVQTQIVA
jgi:organic hydroperoxide reductase OsmC/OhrA